MVSINTLIIISFSWLFLLLLINTIHEEVSEAFIRSAARFFFWVLNNMKSHTYGSVWIPIMVGIINTSKHLQKFVIFATTNRKKILLRRYSHNWGITQNLIVYEPQSWYTDEGSQLFQVKSKYYRNNNKRNSCDIIFLICRSV